MRSIGEGAASAPSSDCCLGDRVINPDARDIIRVYLNVRADDASTVPVVAS